MKSKKGIYLFLALLLPILIFLFLRFFGRNEFAVKPLYDEDYPPGVDGCEQVARIPYLVHDSVMSKVSTMSDSLTVIFFGALNGEAANQFMRVKEEIAEDRISVRRLEPSKAHDSWKRCVFFLKDSIDVVLVDRKGTIYGNYLSRDREEMDRLLTEITIILKKY